MFCLSTVHWIGSINAVIDLHEFSASSAHAVNYVWSCILLSVVYCIKKLKREKTVEGMVGKDGVERDFKN